VHPVHVMCILCLACASCALSVNISSCLFVHTSSNYFSTSAWFKYNKCNKVTRCLQVLRVVFMQCTISSELIGRSWFEITKQKLYFKCTMFEFALMHALVSGTFNDKNWWIWYVQSLKPIVFFLKLCTKFCR